jgi:hypothetical protein
VCTWTVAADGLVPAGDDADDELAPAAGAADDADDPPELPELPELQAAARTPAAASGRPNLRAIETFLDDSNLFICCAFSFRWNTERPAKCLAPLNTPPPQRQFDQCAMSCITASLSPLRESVNRRLGGHVM